MFDTPQPVARTKVAGVARAKAAGVARAKAAGVARTKAAGVARAKAAGVARAKAAGGYPAPARGPRSLPAAPYSPLRFALAPLVAGHPPAAFALRLGVVAALVLLLLLPASAPAATGAFRSWDEGLAEAKKSGRPIVVDVFTSWCGWCKKMDREVYARADVQRYLGERYVAIKLDAESAAPVTYEGRRLTAKSLASQFRVSGYPTTIFLRADGTHLANVPGYVPADRFLLLLRFVGEGHAERGEKFADFERKAQGR